MLTYNINILYTTVFFRTFVLGKRHKSQIKNPIKSFELQIFFFKNHKAQNPGNIEYHKNKALKYLMTKVIDIRLICIRNLRIILEYL